MRTGHAYTRDIRVIIKDHLKDPHLLYHVVGVDKPLLQQDQQRGLGGLPHLAIGVCQESRMMSEIRLINASHDVPT